MSGRARHKRLAIRSAPVARADAALLEAYRNASGHAPGAHARRLRCATVGCCSRWPADAPAREAVTARTAALSRDVARRGLSGRASRECSRRGGRSTGSAIGPRCRDRRTDPCAGLKAPKAPRAACPRRCRPTRPCSLVDEQSKGDDARSRSAIARCSSSPTRRDFACPSSPGSTSTASISRRRSARLGQGRQGAHRAGGRARARSDAGWLAAAVDAACARTQRACSFSARGRRITPRAIEQRLAEWAVKRGPPAARSSAHAAPLVRLACAAVLRRSARGAGDARPREHRQHAGLHAPRLPGIWPRSTTTRIRGRARRSVAILSRLDGRRSSALLRRRDDQKNGALGAPRKPLRRN